MTESDEGAVYVLNATMPRVRVRQPLHIQSACLGFMAGMAYYCIVENVAYLATEGVAKLSANFGPWADVTTRLVIVVAVIAAGRYWRIF